MLRILDAVEYRFVVPGHAVSFRSPNSPAYKTKVRRCARVAMPREPLADAVEIRIDYFHTSKRRCDMDNVAKAVMDALNGLAYIDDQLATLQSATAHDLTRRITLAGGPVDLVKPLKHHKDYVIVRIRIAD